MIFDSATRKRIIGSTFTEKPVLGKGRTLALKSEAGSRKFFDCKTS
jgi:hypothetical protein